MSDQPNLSRRDLLASAGGLSLALTSGIVQALEPEPEAEKPKGPPIPCAIIGTGVWGRQILRRLARQQNMPQAICDTFAVNLRRAVKLAPEATAFADYRAMLDQHKAVQAVFVATPTHLHRQVVADCLQAGKHVYCEAPLGHTLGEAKAVAKLGVEAKAFFQPGLQNRGNKMHLHVLKFVRSGVLGNVAQARLSYHRKTSWRRASATPEAERKLNWRLDAAISPGIVGELGMHQVDVATMFLRRPPLKVTGFGAIMHWKDGREVADTVQCIFEYRNEVRVLYDATLTNSFGGESELFMGSNTAILVQGQNAWMIKEDDAPLLGWEVYARKEDVGKQTGIALVADATKLLKMGLKPGQDPSTLMKNDDALHYAVDGFLQSIRENKKPAYGPQQGLEATVVGLAANEAIKTGKTVTIEPEWFQIG